MAVRAMQFSRHAQICFCSLASIKMVQSRSCLNASPARRYLGGLAMKGAAVGGASWAVWRLIRRQTTGPAAPTASSWPTVDAVPPSADDHGRVQASARPVLGVYCAPAFDSACTDYACETNACLCPSLERLFAGEQQSHRKACVPGFCQWADYW